MKKVFISIVVAILFLLTAVGSFVFGAKTDRHEFSKALYETQAMLWFNHLLQFREIEANQAKGCSAEALEATRIAIDQEMRWLSEFHKENADSSLNKYISDRDPKLLSQLESFKSKYGGSWTVPQCEK